MPPAGYLRAVREICTRHDVLMIADALLAASRGPIRLEELGVQSLV